MLKPVISHERSSHLREWELLWPQHLGERADRESTKGYQAHSRRV